MTHAEILDSKGKTDGRPLPMHDGPRTRLRQDRARGAPVECFGISLDLRLNADSFGGAPHARFAADRKRASRPDRKPGSRRILRSPVYYRSGSHAGERIDMAK